MARLSWLCLGTQGAQPGSTGPSQASFTLLPAPAGVWKDLHPPSDAVNTVDRWSDLGLLRSALGRWALRLPFLLRYKDKDRRQVQKRPRRSVRATSSHALAARTLACPLDVRSLDALSCITAGPHLPVLPLPAFLAHLPGPIASKPQSGEALPFPRALLGARWTAGHMFAGNFLPRFPRLKI